MATRISLLGSRRKRAGIVVAVLVALGVPAAWASDRFTDVPNSNPHHDDINTIARIGITSGCTPTLYCPTDPVTRQQMGSFLARTLRTITPAVRVGASNGGAVDPDANPVVCATGPFNPTVQVDGLIAGGFVNLKQAAAGELGYRVIPVVSTDGGATLVDTPDAAAFHTFETSAASGAWSSAPASPVVFLGTTPGTSTRYGLRVARESGTADASDSRCRIVVTFAYADAGSPSIGG